MRCSKIQDNYEEYITGTLDPAIAARVDRHLAVCDPCRDAYEENDDLSELINQSSEVVHPGAAYLEDLTKKVVDSLYDETGEFIAAPEEPRRARVLPIFESLTQVRWAAGAVAAALLLIPMAISLFRTSDSQPVAYSPDGRPVAPAQTAALPQIDPEATGADAFSGDTVPKGVRSGIIIDKSIAASTDLSPLGGNGPEIHPVALRPEQNISTSPDLTSNDPEIASLASPSAIERAIQLLGADTPQSRQELFPLLRQLARAMADRDSSYQSSGEEVLAHQSGEYYRAEMFRAQGDLPSAIEDYQRLVERDPNSVLGRRGTLQIADIQFYEMGDFASAFSNYAKSMELSSDLVFSTGELAHVRSQWGRLAFHAQQNWEPLELIHILARGEWNEAAAAIDRMAQLQTGTQSWPEAVATVFERLANLDLPGDEVAFQTVDTVEALIESESDAETKGWLYLLQGDIIWFQFEGREPATNAYQQALNLDANNQSGQLATQRLQNLRDGSALISTH